MATGEETSPSLNDKTVVLKVNIHCEGCKKKVTKILKTVQGISSTNIDIKQNKVTVIGNIDAETLIQTLRRKGKPAEIWPEQKPSNPNPNPSSSSSNSNNNGDKPKNKEKEPSKSNEPSEISEKKQAAAPVVEENNTAATAAKPPPETPAKSAEPVAKLSTEASGNSKKEAPKPDQIPEKEQPSTATDPESSTKGGGASGKKKGKKTGGKAAAVPVKQDFVGNSGNLPPQLPTYQLPVYQQHQPAVGVSYSMAQPTANNSYYAPMASVPQNYMYSGYPTPPQEYYHPQPQESQGYYPSQEYYYESMEPTTGSASTAGQGSYDVFSDENANGCNVM